jgi:hypothetical protein
MQLNHRCATVNTRRSVAVVAGPLLQPFLTRPSFASAAIDTAKPCSEPLGLAPDFRLLPEICLFSVCLPACVCLSVCLPHSALRRSKLQSARDFPRMLHDSYLMHALITPHPHAQTWTTQPCKAPRECAFRSKGRGVTAISSPTARRHPSGTKWAKRPR